jgi:hypothetical protein
MDNKKFETLIDLIINEDEDNARALFHDIVVEKSREIYESMMDEEHMGGKIGGLLDEISVEEEGMTEEEDEFADIEVDDDGMGDEDSMELDSDDMDDMDGEEDLEDRVVDLEDKLDELMAEFEQIMGNEEHEEHEEGSEEEQDDEEQDDEDMMETYEEDTLEEAIQLKKVSVTHGDNGQNSKSVVSSGSKVQSNGAKAVNAFGGDEKGGTVKAPATIPGKYKNAPGQDGSKTEAAPKAKAGDNGSNTKSVIESKKSVKKIVK